jgi:hypothetical protein
VFGGSPFLRRATVDLGILPADMEWIDELTAVGARRRAPPA